MRPRPILCIVCVLCLVSRAAQAAEEASGSEPAVAIVGGTVISVGGPVLRRGTVICRQGKIEAVGVEIELPAGAQVVDAAGKYVCPGFVAIEATDLGVEATEGGIADGLDPYDLSLRIALASGITTAHVIEAPPMSFFGHPSRPSTGTKTAIIKLTQGDLGAMLVQEPGLNYFAMPSRQVELNLFRIREGFRKAAEHLANVKEATAKKVEPPKAPPEIAPYVTILENKQPTVVAAEGREEIADILAINAAYPFDLVLSGLEESYPLAREITARGIPVLLAARGEDFDFDLSRPVLDRDGLVPIRLPAAFADLGAQVTLLPYRNAVSVDGIAGRDLAALPFEAAFAVRGGLDEARALEAITLQPARVLRIDERVGSLEKGKDADILILNRHPLHYLAFVEKAYINGKLYYDRAESPLFRGIPLR